MDVLGTKKFLAMVEKELGVILPKTNADIEKLGKALDSANLLLLEGEDLIQDIDKIVQTIPAEWQKLVGAILTVLSQVQSTAAAGDRTIQRVSTAIQTWDDGVQIVVGKDGKFGDNAVSGTITITPIKK